MKKYSILLVIMVLLVMCPIKFAVAQKTDRGNFIMNAFVNYIELVRDNCDFKRQFPKELLLDLSPSTQASCFAMLYDIDQIGNSVRRFDIMLRCEEQTEMTLKDCEDNLKLCQRKFHGMRGIIENCRSKIRIDSAALKYKKD